MVWWLVWSIGISPLWTVWSPLGCFCLCPPVTLVTLERMAWLALSYFQSPWIYKNKMCLWHTNAFVKHKCTGSNKFKWRQKFQSYILATHPPQGHVMSLSYDQPLGSLTVQVWLLNYVYPNLNYCTSFEVGRNYRQKDGQTEGLPYSGKFSRTKIFAIER